MDTKKTAASLLVALTMILAACGGAETEGSTTQAPATTVATTQAPTTVPETTALTTEAPTTTEATTTTEAPTTTITVPPTELDDVVGGTAVGDGWLVEPGRYVTDRAGPSLVFEVEEQFTYHENENLVVLRPPELSERDIIVISTYIGIIPADEIGTHPPHDPPIPANTIDVPADLGEWFDAAPQVVVGGSGEVSMPAGSAPYWDVTVDPTAGDTFDCFLGNCVANLVHEDGNGAWVFGDEYSFRIYQLNGALEGVFVFVQAQPDNFEAVASLSERVVGSISMAG